MRWRETFPKHFLFTSDFLSSHSKPWGQRWNDQRWGLDVCVNVRQWVFISRMHADKTLMPRCLKVDRLAEVWGVRKTARSVSAGGQRCYSQIQPPISVKGVVCHTRIQTVLLQLVILCQQSPQAFSPLTFSLCHTQTNKKPRVQLSQACSFSDTVNLQSAALVSCQLC